MLSSEQYQHFQTFGFVVLRPFFTAAEVVTVPTSPFSPHQGASHARRHPAV